MTVERGALRAIVAGIYDCFAVGDLDGVLRHADPDIVLTQDDRLPWGGRHVGRDGVASFGLALAMAVDTAVTPELLFEAGDTVVQVGRSRGTGRESGGSYDVPECHVWTFRGTKVVAVDMYVESDTVLDALRS